MVFFTELALAHGGVGIKGNKCILTVGEYSMLFTGYQPKTSGKEFCDDIPLSGKTIIVLDFIDPILRTMAVDYRVMNDVNNLGITATKQELGSQDDIEKNSLLYLQPKIYQKGTFMLDHSFQDGRYIGIVTATNIETGKVITSVFPFTVGSTAVGRNVLIIIAALVSLIGFYLFYRRKRLNN